MNAPAATHTNRSASLAKWGETKPQTKEREREGGGTLSLSLSQIYFSFSSSSIHRRCTIYLTLHVVWVGTEEGEKGPFSSFFTFPGHEAPPTSYTHGYYIMYRLPTTERERENKINNSYNLKMQFSVNTTTIASEKWSLCVADVTWHTNCCSSKHLDLLLLLLSFFFYENSFGFHSLLFLLLLLLLLLLLFKFQSVSVLGAERVGGGSFTKRYADVNMHFSRSVFDVSFFIIDNVTSPFIHSFIHIV